MRIIAGQHRGRTLASPGQATRPITDRAKQSLFDVLTPYVQGARVYDCFAGTGSMGLECLSRGATSALFFETDRAALRGLRANIAALHLTAQAKVVATDLFKWFEASRVNGPRIAMAPAGDDREADPTNAAAADGGEPHRPEVSVDKQPIHADLIFLDPPYRYLNERAAALKALARRLGDHLGPDGLLVFRHDSADALLLPPMQTIDVRTYGTMTIELLRRPDGMTRETDERPKAPSTA